MSPVPGAGHGHPACLTIPDDHYARTAEACTAEARTAKAHTAKAHTAEREQTLRKTAWAGRWAQSCRQGEREAIAAATLEHSSAHWRGGHAKCSSSRVLSGMCLSVPVSHTHSVG